MKFDEKYEMMYEEILTEMFNTKVKIKVIKETNSLYVLQAVIGKSLLTVDLKRKTDVPVWEMIFSHQALEKGGKWSIMEIIWYELLSEKHRDKDLNGLSKTEWKARWELLSLPKYTKLISQPATIIQMGNVILGVLQQFFEEFGDEEDTTVEIPVRSLLGTYDKEVKVASKILVKAGYAVSNGTPGIIEVSK